MRETAEDVGIPRGGVVAEVPRLNLMFHYDVDPEEDAIIQAGFGGWVPCGMSGGGGLLESVQDVTRGMGRAGGSNFEERMPEEAQLRLPSSLEPGLFVGDRGSVLKTLVVCSVCVRANIGSKHVWTRAIANCAESLGSDDPLLTSMGCVLLNVWGCLYDVWVDLGTPWCLVLCDAVVSNRT